MRTHFVLFLLVSSVFLGNYSCYANALKQKFYRKSCPSAETIVKNVVWNRVSKDSGLAAALLRLHFHDCFVRGCDGSVLLNSPSKDAEKDAEPNMSLVGFDVIDEVKTAVEKACPGVVSCADILALSARDAVSFQFKKPLWDVYTGRKDGRISKASEAVANLPQANSTFPIVQQNFARKNLSLKDLVVLSGAHTIGDSHCNSFSKRLYNFTGKGDADPSLDPTYAASLRTKCRNLQDKTTTVPMDFTTPTTFDTNYYRNVKQNKGLFQSDASLLTNGLAKKLVDELLSPSRFFTEFGISMKKMGSIEVLTGASGEIRKVCSAVN